MRPILSKRLRSGSSFAQTRRAGAAAFRSERTRLCHSSRSRLNTSWLEGYGGTQLIATENLQ